MAASRPVPRGWATMGAGVPIIKLPTLGEIHFEGGESKDLP